MKEIFIADLAQYEEGRSFDAHYLVTLKQQRTTKTNKPYWNLILGDRTGQIEARIWDPTDPRISPDFEQGDVVKARASTTLFDGKLQLKVDQLRKAIDSEFDRTDLLPATQYDVKELWAQLEGFIASFTNKDLQQLLRAILGLPGMKEDYCEAPAASRLHHAWLGGLLEHVVSLLGLADVVVPRYPILNRDLVLTGVILHDIGKVRELRWKSGFEYTIEGQLLGHISIAASLVEQVIDTLPDFPQRLKVLVLHMILSHHGKLEFGSPKIPMIPEALMLSFLDDLDAKMQTTASELEKAAKMGRGPDGFTDKVWALDQRQLLNSQAWLDAESLDDNTSEEK